MALHPPFAAWATGGLATMPFALLLFLAFEGLVWGRAGWPAGLALLGVALIRVEGIAWAVVLLGLGGAVRWRGRRSMRSTAGAAVLLAVGFALYQGWRLDYYAAASGNTVERNPFGVAGRSRESRGGVPSPCRVARGGFLALVKAMWRKELAP